MRPKIVEQMMDMNSDTLSLFENKKGVHVQSTPEQSSRNVIRGIWELGRLHTREAWLCWYPAGTHSPPSKRAREEDQNPIPGS